MFEALQKCDICGEIRRMEVSKDRSSITTHSANSGWAFDHYNHDLCPACLRDSIRKGRSSK